jgi:hypothetical protein
MSYETSTKKAIVFSKKLFENSAGMICMLQDNTEKISYDFLKRIPGISEEGLKPYNESVALYKDMRDGFIKLTTENFENLEKMF